MKAIIDQYLYPLKSGLSTWSDFSNKLLLEGIEISSVRPVEFVGRNSKESLRLRVVFIRMRVVDQHIDNPSFTCTLEF
jgi:hypothetical protein